ncbi:MAG: hypothetical protein CVU95_03190 [Firmicutes bacterium HGW-Firmicutes-2]|jgi:hypothetical protein|nr:MAG: hypothetical protein CVU95_03190 [Firmicutes bacterium HGW-Firmicutes-2]
MKALNKLIILGMVLTFCVIVLVGCKTNKVDTSTTPPTVENENEVAADPTTDPTTDVSEEDPDDNSTDSEVIKQGTIKKDGNVILKELAFVYNDNTVTIYDVVDDEKLEGILGTAVEIKSHTYAIDDGLNMDPLIGFTEKQYVFNGLEIRTIKAPEDDKFYIFQILITDTKYATIRNIKVGDTVTKLKSVYPEGNMSGNGAPNEEDQYIYLPVNYVDGMIFHVKDEVIGNISMYKLLY